MVTPELPNETRVMFETLYQAHYKSIYAYVRRRTSSSSDVSDIVSEVFTVAWRRISELPPPPQDRLWLFGVARRCLLAHQRGRWNRLRLLSNLEAQPNRIELVNAETDPLHLQVQSALRDLRAKDQEVLVLVYWDGLSHVEAASVLDCSVNAVALRVKKAKGRLQTKLAASISPPNLNFPALMIQKEQLP
jgi:RNA polymerase sigma-70 factor (ECF subfamily)